MLDVSSLPSHSRVLPSGSFRSRKRCIQVIGAMAIASQLPNQATAFVPKGRPKLLWPTCTPTTSISPAPWLRSNCAALKPSQAPITSTGSTSALQSSLGQPSLISWFYLGALAVQFGVQPLLTKAYAPSGIVRSTVIMAQDLVRFLTCLLVLVLGGAWQTSLHTWTLQGALLGAGIPSVLYLIQNYFALIAYQALSPVTFNILNQTKTLSAALCCYLILGRQQSAMQILALFLLLLSALVIEKVIPITRNVTKDVAPSDAVALDETGQSKAAEPKIAAGVVPVLIASFTSGLAGAVSQKNLQELGHNAYVFSMELSAFSMLIMLITLLGSPDGKKLRSSGLSNGWTWKTWIPVFTNATGGILVGLVTKHHGVVRKGFALILGLFLSGILQSCFLSDEGITKEQILGGIIASISVWMHSTFLPTS